MTMRLGMYTPEMRGDTAGEVFARAAAMGFSAAQYNFLTSHGAEMPERILPCEAREIADAARENGIEIAAVNGTFNMIDEAALEENLRRFEQIAKACRPLGCGIVTLCTGSRHPESMWRFHRDTASPGAWKALIAATRRLLPIAREYGLLLGVETEASNVVSTAERTRRYLDEIASPCLGVIMDCANLFPAGTAYRDDVAATIRNAFALLGGDIILAHAKDVCEGDETVFAAPGMGIVDYPLYFRLLREAGYDGSLILHGIHGEDEFGPAIAAMREAGTEPVTPQSCAKRGGDT